MLFKIPVCPQISPIRQQMLFTSVRLVPFYRIPKPLTAPFSTNVQIGAFLANLRLLAAFNTTAVWLCPIGFTTGTERLSWVAQFPYLAEHSYVDECFREQGPGPVWMGMFITPIETWVGKSKLAEWHVWAAVIISPEAPGRGEKLLIYDCDGDDVDFQSCRVRDALPLSFQRKLFRRKTPAFAELWRSTYDDSTFGRKQCMKNTCNFLIRAVKSPPRVITGSDGSQFIDGFLRVLHL
ncbi:hypothetical protein B0H13DRAFT_1871072 [Mycena leptocephala]|nr:hypothetical protein B0H13DRAFT_1871072 [Mycena leptocephala]